MLSAAASALLRIRPRPSSLGRGGVSLTRCFSSASGMSSHSPQRVVASVVGQAQQPLSQTHAGTGTAVATGKGKSKRTAAATAAGKGTATATATATAAGKGKGTATATAAAAATATSPGPGTRSRASQASKKNKKAPNPVRGVGKSQSVVWNAGATNDKGKDETQQGGKPKMQKQQKREAEVGAQSQQKQRAKSVDRQANKTQRSKGSQRSNLGQRRKRKARPSSSSSSSLSASRSSFSSEKSLPPPVRRLVVGLGNPGKKYALTRHNVGFTIVEALFDLLRPSAKGGSPGFSFNKVLHADEAGLRLAFEAACTETENSSAITEAGISTRDAPNFLRPLPQIDLVDQLSARRRQRTRDEGVPFPTLDVQILKPQTFMNLSGQSVIFARSGAGSRGTIKAEKNRKADAFLGFPRQRYSFRSDPLNTVNRGDELVVVTDDFDLPFGHLRFRHKNVASHNGLKNITDVLGTNIYVNLRVGIGLPPPPNHPGNPNSVGKLHRGPKAYASYVLEDFTAQEQSVLPDLQRFAVDVLRVYFHRGLAAAQQVAHAQVVSDYASTRDSLAAAALEAATAETAENADAAAAAKRMAVSPLNDAGQNGAAATKK